MQATDQQTLCVSHALCMGCLPARVSAAVRPSPAGWWGLLLAEVPGFSHCSSFPCGRGQAPRPTGFSTCSRRPAVVTHGFTCSAVHEIFLGQGSNLVPCAGRKNPVHCTARSPANHILTKELYPEYTKNFQVSVIEKQRPCKAGQRIKEKKTKNLAPKTVSKPLKTCSKL